jgi:DNA binding domain, excisionase family
LHAERRRRWLTLSDVADMLGVHEGTVRRWADTGKLPSYRTPGGHRRFLSEDVIQFLAQRRGASGRDLQVFGKPGAAQSP